MIDDEEVFRTGLMERLERMNADSWPAVLDNRDGILWSKAPLPRRWHRCQPWTTGWVKWFTFVERCACGGIRMSGHRGWDGKNSRRKQGVTRP